MSIQRARARSLSRSLVVVPAVALGLVGAGVSTPAVAAGAPAVSEVAPSSTDASSGPALPFDLPSTSSLRSSSHKVFAHWVPSLPVSLDNEDPASDYYQRNYLDPEGEGGRHAAYGGYLRDRPLGRQPLSGDWRLQDMQREVRQAISVGLDGFTVVVYNITSGNRTWENVKLMMQAAHSVDPGFKILIQPDMSDALGDKDADTLARAMAELADYPSAYRLGDGRVVLSPFKAEDHSASWWAGMLSLLRTKYATPTAFWPTFLNEQANAADFDSISYGMSNWGSRNPAWTNPDATYSTSPMGRVQKIHDLGQKWMQPISTQDERPRSGIFDEAQNTQNLRNTWEIARRSGSEWAQINTWSDYPEGSQMAPSAKNGWSFLDLSSYYLTWFKTGSAPKIVRDTVYLTHRTQPWAATPRFPQTKLMALRGGSPARDTIEALTFLTAPATVTITAGSRTFSCDADAGADVCTVPLASGTVSATVTRSGATTASVVSPYKVTSSPYVQDLHYVAASSRREGGGDTVIEAAPAPAPTTSTQILTPTADTYANEGAPNTNYGTRSTLASRGGIGAVSYLRFAIPAAPAGKFLTDAVLRLRTTDDSWGGSTSDHAVTIGSNSWDEGSLTWDNRPGTGTTRVGTISTDVAPDAESATSLDFGGVDLSGSTRTFAIRDTGSDNLWFWSSNYANPSYRPHLELTYR